jgi:hypothetical protein
MRHPMCWQNRVNLALGLRCNIKRYGEYIVQAVPVTFKTWERLWWWDQAMWLGFIEDYQMPYGRL